MFLVQGFGFTLSKIWTLEAWDLTRTTSNLFPDDPASDERLLSYICISICLFSSAYRAKGRRVSHYAEFHVSLFLSRGLESCEQWKRLKGGKTPTACV